MKEKCNKRSHIKIGGICTVCGCPAGELTPIDHFLSAPHNIALDVLNKTTEEYKKKHQLLSGE